MSLVVYPGTGIPFENPGVIVSQNVFTIDEEMCLFHVLCIGHSARLTQYDARRYADLRLSAP